MIRIGVISDTHIPDRASVISQKILDDFKNADMVVHLGDLVELSVIDQLKAVCGNVVAVWGNMDSFEVKEELPEKEIIEVGKYRIGLMHGYGHPGKLIELLADKFKDDKVDIIIFGHSHLSLIETRGGVLFFNPGSPTDKIFSPFNSYGIIELNDEIKAKIIEI
jgi:putative phosphoesterase